MRVIDMQNVTNNIYSNTMLRGCNPSFVVTSDGVVVVDTPQLPTKAVAMRQVAEQHGPIRYVINTEHHVDHIFGNYYFRGAGTVVHHQGVYDNFMVVGPDLDPFAYAAEAIPTDDRRSLPALGPCRCAHAVALARRPVARRGHRPPAGPPPSRAV